MIGSSPILCRNPYIQKLFRELHYDHLILFYFEYFLGIF